jgi:hypothetical protein
MKIVVLTDCAFCAAASGRTYRNDGAHPYFRDLAEAEFHLIDTGHFALEDKLDEMAPLIPSFLDRKVAK